MAMHTDCALALRAVHKYFGASHIIRGAELEVRRGERLAIIGPNGAGKSTLFHLISGRIAPSSGEILLNGKPIHGLPPQLIFRQGLARSFQINHVFSNLSVFENIRCALLWALGCRYSFWQRIAGLRHLNARTEEVLQRIGLYECRMRIASQLSYAQLRALEIGLAIAADAQVLLLDEPTAGMSRAETAQAVELIRSVSAGKTLLMVEHDMNVVFGLADRIAVLVYGEVIACDAPAAVRANARVQEAYLGSLGQAGEGAS
ncbi:ABC transporter ATP-binding protein [Massilia sp. W12]|uniref:ABC transporter ATP-binding protein n=2 Tax=Massilia sp. W12 TaxID=3126507 RepID=UPI0030D5F463